jgi:O-Antigen ligase
MPSPDARALLGGLPAGPFRRSGWGLLAVAFLAPFAATHVAGPLTVGRVSALCLGALLAWDVIERRPRELRLGPATILLASGYAGLCCWAFLNAATWGCNCEGKSGGLFELTAVGLLVLAAVSLEPRFRGPALLAALAGVTAAAVLALAGVGAINSGTVDLTQTGGRLSGLYGNANELGLAAALGLPIALALATTRAWLVRGLALAAAAVLLVTLGLTYSRGGILAAAAGILALALWEARGSRKRIAMILVVAVALAGAGAGLYSIFKEKREGASFEAVPQGLAGLDQRDLTGWDTRALGPVPRGGSDLRNTAGGLAVETSRPGQGASFGIGEANAGTTYVLHLRVRSLGGAGRLGYALGDRLRGAPAEGLASLGTDPRDVTLRWTPRRPAPHAALSIWNAGGGPGFVLGEVGLLETTGPGFSRAIRVPLTMRGSVYERLTGTANSSETRYVESRLEAAKLAWRAFRSDPIQGIGWSTFPTYSAEQLDFGRLAAHDQYLLVAAELGLIGIGFLALLLVAPVVGIRRALPGLATSAALGVLVTAAVGMVFVETLAAPQLAVPITIAAAVLAGGAGPQRLRTRSLTPTPSPSEAIAVK